MIIIDVIHAVGPYTAMPDALSLLRSAYINSLRLMRKYNKTKVAFPLISASRFNNAHLPYKVLWETAISAVRDFMATYPEYEMDVVFVCHGHEVIDAGNAVLNADHEGHYIDRHPERDDDFGVWMAERDGLVKTRYRIYTAPKGQFRDSSQYEFVAEFATNKLVNKNCKGLRNPRFQALK